jgi:hypothetical protein
MRSVSLSSSLTIGYSDLVPRQALPRALAIGIGLRRYPDMTVDIITEGQLVDIVVEGSTLASGWWSWCRGT